MTNRAERGALIALLEDRPAGATWRQLTDDIAERGSALAVYHRYVEPDLFDSEDTAAGRIERAAVEIDRWEAQGIGVHTVHDDTFPPQLRDVLHMPPVVFTRGTRARDERAVAIVGSRQASSEGLAIADRLAIGLAGHGFTIVSGGAAGIDSAAHEAALREGARTVAVIGTGVCKYYPPENRDLHDRIAETGMVLSQFLPDAPPTKTSFPCATRSCPAMSPRRSSWKPVNAAARGSRHATPSNTAARCYWSSRSSKRTPGHRPCGTSQASISSPTWPMSSLFWKRPTTPTTRCAGCWIRWPPDTPRTMDTRTCDGLP